MTADSAVATIPDASAGSLGPALRRVQRAANAGTTPAKLRLLLVVLLALTALWGIVAASTVAARTSAADNIVGVSEPLTVDAQQIYRSLSDADATEAAAFLSGGIEPQRLRDRYQADIAQAARRLVAATAVAGSDQVAGSRLATLAAGLPVYTGLIETARADNRLGYPLGAAYLRQASYFMRKTLLPVANSLYGQENAQLAAANRKATAFPYLAAVVALVTTLAFGWSQRWLTRRTRRILNVGLALASLAGLAAVIWLAASLSVARTQFVDARTKGSIPVEALARADIAALQAHADESLTLIDRQGTDSFQRDFGALQRQLGPGPGTLLSKAAADASGSPGGSAAAAAVPMARAWFAVHRQVRALDNTGDYTHAVALAIGSGTRYSGTLFGHLDTDLTSAIGADQAAFQSYAQSARSNLTLVEAGVIVLSIMMAAGCAWGVSRRLAEYR